MRLSAALASEWHFFPGLPKWSPETVSVWTPGTLGVHNFSPNLRLGQGLKKTCSSPWEFSNGVSHSTCTHHDQVDSQLLVVGSQIANLTPGPSFSHNLCYSVQMAHARPFRTSTFQDLSYDIKNTSMRGVLTLTIVFWIFENFRRLPSPISESVSGDLTLPSKWGCDNHGHIPWEKDETFILRNIMNIWHLNYHIAFAIGVECHCVAFKLQSDLIIIYSFS
jgi:hypothetical protein